MLSLADNSLEEMVPRLFQQLTKLKYLDLSGNPLEDLTPDIFRDISVRKCALTSYLAGLKRKLSFCHQDIRVLKCRRCGVKKINPQLYHLLQQLTELDLGANQVIYLIVVMGTLLFLSSIKLSIAFHLFPII
jgi:Leucine-rich repeat (LRR) protein